jgi:hypothetical protein
MSQDEKQSAEATDRWDEEREREDRYSNPSKNGTLEPALPVGKCLIDKLLVIMGGKISRVMFEAFHNEFTLLGSKELGGGWILKDGSMTSARWQNGTHIIHVPVCNECDDYSE